MALISKKKLTYRISPQLGEYLAAYDREAEIPLRYTDLLRYDNSIPLYDKNGTDTLWETVFYPQSEHEHIHESLKHIYAVLKADGDMSVMRHLYVDRIDLCVYGNTQPFRVRIVNRVNDNFDYFYVKNADASRIYGLELEHILSPNRISYLVYGQTLIEEHIAGIPGDQFFKHYLNEKTLNPIRLAKEFVKFNERCFVRLLGDMHSNNFVVVITPDFEELHYRIRAIDFDQQSYEPRKAVYMPQYFKQNNPLIEIGIKHMTPESMKQYQKEERTLIAHRIRSSQKQLKILLDAMGNDRIAPPEHVEKLKNELAQHHQHDNFLKCNNMGGILKTSLMLLLQNV
jgi:hypothetical protein